MRFDTDYWWLTLVVCVAAGGWYGGFRWRSFAVVIGAALLGGAIGWLHGVLTTPPDPGMFDGLRILGEAFVGSMAAAGIAFLALLCWHQGRRRHHRSRVRALVTAPDVAPAAGIAMTALQLEAGLGRIEEREPVKYVPCSGPGVATYEDWLELLVDAGGATAFLMVPRRHRVRPAAGGASPDAAPACPVPVQATDCVVIRRTPSDGFHVVPVSGSRFCRAVMESLRAARVEPA